MPLFGTISIWTALIAVAVSVVCYITASLKRGAPDAANRLTRAGRVLFAVGAAAIFAAAATLATLLVTHRFDVAYVYQHSARAMAPLYWFPAFWAGQEGSFLLWSFWTALLGLVLAATAGNAERRVMPVYSGVLLFLISLLVLRSPFLLLDTQGLPTPTEGLGLNPNLENPWMVIHPPTLFLGFSSLAIPFAFAISALLWRDWDGWLRRTLPWGLFGFAVLGLAMMMGGYWAYEMLGWGGFWEWDPVENGPFIPWISLVAFLHAAQIQRVRGGFSRPTLLFATLPFLGAMYESFMTRSGILANFSVHSFSQLGGIANTLLLSALLFVVVLSVGALAWRSRLLAARDAGAESVLEVPTSREYGYTLAIILLTLCAVIAAVGMSAPLLTGLGVKLHLMRYSASVSEDYHNKAMFPLAVLVAIGMGIGPHLAWRGQGRTDSRRLVSAYAISVAAGLAYILAARLLGTGLTGAKLVPQLILFTASVFAIVSGILVFSGRVGRREAAFDGADGAPATVAHRPSAWTAGGLFSHIGVATLLIGVVCLVTFVRKDTDVQLYQRMPQSVLNGRYVVTYLGQTSDYRTDRNNALLFHVTSRNGKEAFTARIPFALRATEGGGAKQLFGHPAIIHHAGGDLYLVAKDGPNKFYTSGRHIETVKLGGSQKYGPYTIQFVKFERDPAAAAFVTATRQMPPVFPMWAVLRVSYLGHSTLVQPRFILHRDDPVEPEAPEVALPGGWLIAFDDRPDAINAGSSDPNNPNAGATNESARFVLRPVGPILEGFDLDVTTRPMISLVWVGTLLIFVGGMLSMGRRIRENRALPIPDLPDAPPAKDGLGGRRRPADRKAPPGVVVRRRVKGRVQTQPAPSLSAGRSTGTQG